MQSQTPIQITQEGLRWNDGSGHEQSLSSFWLRDNCHCAACRHPGNGQKLYAISDLAQDLRASDAKVADDGGLDVLWSDGHRSHYRPDLLRDRSLSDAARALRRTAAQLWNRELGANLPEGDWPTMLEDPAAELAWLERYSALGFGLLHRVPCESGMVAEVGNRLGHVRVTNYGRLFDVKSVPNPNNLADTALGLGVHSDNPYRNPSPGMQLLHCLESEAPGGDTLLVDGFAAAELLRQEDPEGFDLLCRLPLNFRYANADTELQARQTLISVDPEGLVHGVHFNNRSADWLDAPADQVSAWYRAYIAFARILQRPELELIFRLGPGDLIVMQNDRTLHGRTAFDPNLGRRHLQGCYIDRDGVESRRQVLRRRLAV